MEIDIESGRRDIVAIEMTKIPDLPNQAIIARRGTRGRDRENVKKAKGWHMFVTLVVYQHILVNDAVCLRSALVSRSRSPTALVPRSQRSNKKRNFDVMPPGVTPENAAEYAAQAILQRKMAALSGAVGPESFGPPSNSGVGSYSIFTSDFVF